MRIREYTLARAILCTIMIVAASPLPVLAQAATPVPTPPPPAAPAPTSAPSAEIGDPEAALQTATEYIKVADYTPAIKILEKLIERSEFRVEILRNAYLTLITALYHLGDQYKQREEESKTAEYYYKDARARIEQCLRVRELRHTRPAEELYPRRMRDDFELVRNRIFGSFRVTDVRPDGAVVLFDADTLRALPADSSLGDVDLPVGKHLVVVRYPGYRDETEEITISPGITESRTFNLQKRRGAAWYATRGGALGAAVGVLVAILTGRSEGGSTATPPLGEPPPPPTRPR